RKCFPGERALLILAGRGAQRAVQVEGPAVIVALQGHPVAGAFEDDLAAAMTAYVGESAKRSAGVSKEHDRQVAQMRREKIAGAIQLPGMSHVLPGAMEDALLLGLKDAGVNVPAGGKSIAAFERAGDRRVGVEI